ncbi:hypothetical protein CK203_094817 [Vitis vinifera]|uniref:SREBP regulating gene protein n=1 Tax=Vitis vinifera TaxID=29760 RepID=A0A438CZF2_VITVI|nr:hypothetical protein CK203_094817 [Vitis vinifera]
MWKDPNLLEKRICRTTVQGRYLRTDDNGHVCDALSMDPQSGCCFGKREQFSCHGCNLISQCCNSYEFCVSCCLNPARTQKELALKVKMAKPVTADLIEGIFEGLMQVFLISVLGGAVIILRVWYMKMLILAISITAFLCHQILQVKFEGPNGGTWVSVTERSRGFVVSIGFGKEELDWLTEHLKKAVELEDSRGFI